MPVSRRLVLATLFLAAVAAASRIALSAQGSRVVLQRDRWAVSLQTERPYFAVGEDLLATWRIPNGSPFDAFGVAFARGGNGCQYRVTLEDAAGNTVWQPGSIVNGQFSGPGCFFSHHAWNLQDGSNTEVTLSLPLVYQNSAGVGVLGDPLPAGFYRVCLEVHFNGPHATPVVSETPVGGLNHTASLPIQIG